MSKKTKAVFIALELVLSIVLVFFSLSVFGACKQAEEPDATSESESAYKATYTVTFDSNGGTLVRDQVVRTGKTAKAPDIPVKNGYFFVGWYNELTDARAFDFSTPIYSDITLHAMWRDAKDEFKVTYIVDGEEYTVGYTNKAIITDLPTPEKQGKTFAGWWTSDYNDASKLTGKYTGAMVYEDTMLYAVWKEDGIQLSVTETGVTWVSTAANQSFKVTVIFDENSEDPVTVTTNKFDYDFAKADAGDYVVQVQIVGGKTYTAYFKNKALARVTKISVDENVISWEPVQGATEYYVLVDCGDEAHEHKRTSVGEKREYDFSNCEMQVGGIEFIIYASAKGFATSESAVFTVERLLAEVKNLAVNDEKATWAAVEKADQYHVEITAGETVDVYTKEPSVDLTAYTGNITVKVTPMAYGYAATATATAEKTYNKTKLASPEFTFEGTELVWKEVAGAVGYRITVGNDKSDYAANVLRADLGEYVGKNITVQALAANSANDSVAVAVPEVKADIKVEYIDGVAYWNPVAGAEKYLVRVNGGEAVETKDVKAEIALTKAGNNTVEVAAVKGGTAGEWYSATVKAYEIAFKTESSLELEKLYVVEGQKYSLPVSEKKGYTFGGWYNDEHAFETYAGKINSTGYFDFGENITVYAQYVPNTYTVTLEYDDGMTEQRTVRFGRGFVFPALETGDNTKKFAGWFSELHKQGTQYTDKYGESITGWYDFTNDVVLHPGWFEVLDYTLIENGTAWSVSKGALISKVSEVTIPVEYEGLPVKEISTFASTSSLKVLNIPDTIERVLLTLDASAFASCYYIEAVNVYPVQGNHERLYASVDGVLFYNNKESAQGVELKYYPYNRSRKVDDVDINPDYVIPSEVLFEDYRNTTREGATEADNVVRRVDTIPTNVFKSTKIKRVTIPATVSKIDKEAFASMSYLEEVIFEDTAEGEEEILLTIGSSAFKSCFNMIEVELPARLKEFKVDIFTSCSKLENVNVSEKSEVYSSKDGVVCSADGTKIIYCPVGKTGEYVIPAGVKVIGESAFEKCTKLTKITIPGFVTTIEKKAFSGCSNVADIIFEGDEIDDALTIGDEAFYGNKLVSELTLAENVKTIGRNAFGNIGSNTAKLTVNIMSAGEVNFSNAAFMLTSSGSISTAYVGTLNIGPKTGTFDINGVAGGTNLEAVNVDEANPYYATIDGVVFDKQITEIIYYPTGKPGDYQIPETVTKIGSKVFDSKTGLTKITINKNITFIGESAFKSCSNLVNVTFEEGGTEALVIDDYAFQTCSKLKSVNLPERTTELGDGVFYSCSALEELYIPASVETIRINHTTRTVNGNTLDYDTVKLFYGCTSLKTLVVDENNEVYASKDNVLYLRDEETSKLTEVLATPRGAVGDIEISADVEKVWDDAFVYTSATKITFPEIKGDLYVGYKAFYYSSIEEVYFADAPEGNTVTFGTEVFYWARSLKKVVLPGGLTTLGKNTFYYDTLLKSIVVPNTVESIESQAFQNCTALSDLTFEEGGEAPLRLEDGANQSSSEQATYYGVFVGCTSLAEVILPERTTYIGKYCFYELKGLRKIVIPANVTEVGQYAFYRCSNLSEVVFADDSELETIGNSAFGYISAPKIVLPEGVKTIGTYSFYNNSALKEVELPSTLEKIDSSAFSYLSNLEKVTFAENSKLTNLVGNTFQYDKSLKSITIPASVETIGNSAFSNCLNLSEVIFEPDSHIKSFGTNVFSKTALRTFDFPVSANNITLGASMFLSCPDLEEVYLSESVINITGAFSGAAALNKITVSENSDNFSSGDGTLPIIYNKAGKIIRYAYGNIKGELHIPEGITEIDNKAFETQALTKVYIPTSMQKIGQYAFAKNRFLTDVIFADDCVVNNIDTYAFVACPRLENINLDKLFNLKTISNYTFRYDESLKQVTLPDSLETIGQYAFAETGLTSIVVPEKVKKIDNYAFNKCYDLKSVDIQGPVATFGTYLFQNDTSLEEVDFGDKIKATDFGNYMFDGCTSLTEIELPSTIVWFGTYTFRNSGLESIEIPENMVALSNYVFQNSKLKEVKIPSKLKYIGASSKTATATTATTASYAFSGCTELEHVDFSEANALALIGTYAFNGCTKLTSVNLPQNKLTLGNYAFADSGINGDLVVSANLTLGTHVFLRTDIESVTINSGATLTASNYAFAETPIKSVVIESTNVGDVTYGLYTSTTVSTGTTATNYNIENKGYITSTSYLKNGAWFYKCDQLESVTLNQSTTILGNMMFAGCTSLKAIDLPASLNKIGNCAFANSGLESVVIPSGVTALANASNTNYTASSYGAMFYQCEDLREVTLPKDITALSQRLFDGCTSLEKITYAGAPEAAEGTEEEAIQVPSTLTVVGNYALSNTGFKKVTLPAVKTPGTYIFANSALEEVIIPEGATTLPGYLLNGCKNIKKITLPSTISATGIGSALANTGIEEITIPDNVTSLPASTFANCDKLAKVNLNKVKEIGANAFDGCISLKSIDLSGITAIGNYAFRGTGLTSVDVPDSVTRIGGTASTTHDGSRSNVMWVFANCTSLKRVSLPEGILWIGAYNFSGCTALEEINIPSTVTVIGVGAFKNCTSLTSIEIPEGVDSISSGAFDGCGITEITVPASMADIYASSAPNPFPGGTTEPSYKNPFVNAYKLEKITVAEGNSVYMSDDDGNFYTIDGKLLSVPMGKTGKLTISATEIDSTAFFGTQATEIVIKAGVTDLANYAMAGMDKVRSVTLPEGIETIGTYAFAGSENLEKVNIPGSVAIINNFTFKGCVKLNDLTIGDGVTTIGVSATSSNTTVFEGCDSLKTINIPDSVYEIGKYAFAKWTGADTVVIDNENIVTIPQYAFQDSGVKHVVLGANIQTVEMYAFKNCDSLETVVFKGPTVISGSSAFAECDALKSVVFEDPDATITASSAFQKCTALESFTFPANMAEIPSSMFSGCSALTSVTLGENIATINSSVFQDCLNLKSIYIPANVMTISSGAFRNWTEEQTIYVELEDMDLPGTWFGTGYTNTVVWNAYCNAKVVYGVAPEDYVG